MAEHPPPPPPPPLAATDPQQLKRKRKREQQKANRQNNSVKKVKQLPSDDLSEKPQQVAPNTKANPSNTKPAKAHKLKRHVEPKNPAKPERVNDSIAMMDPKLIADFVGQKLRRFEKDLSSIELEDYFVPERSFGNTTGWELKRSLGNLPSFLQNSVKLGPLPQHCELDQAPEEPGAPHTIIVAAAALRATDLVRAAKSFQTKENIVAKLFAKHIKLKEAAEHCRNTRMGIAVGTPKRIYDLLQDGVLQSSDLERIVIDASAVNDKNQGIFDIRETYSALIELLNYSAVKERLGEQTTILLY